MKAWKTIKRQIGAKYWLAAENTGPIGSSTGVQRQAPRMTVIDDTCRTVLLANLVSIGSFFVFPAIFLVGAIVEPEKLLNGWVMFMGVLVTVNSVALLNGLIAAIRLDTLMPVVGSPLVKGIHFDWGKPKEADKAEVSEVDETPEDGRVGAFKDMLQGERRA